MSLHAGSLEVFKHAGVTHVYRVYNSSRCYSRSLYSNVWSGWARAYDTANKPGAVDVGALPLQGGTIDGSVTVTHSITANENVWAKGAVYVGDSDSGLHSNGDGGCALWANGKSAGYWNTSNFYWTAGQIIPSNYANFDLKYQPKGNYTPAGEAYTKAAGDLRYVLADAASYAGFVSNDAANPYFRHKSSNTVINLATRSYTYSKAESDARFQAKGSYTPAGEAYTKAVSDGRFQAKGSYTPAGEAYTKAVSDGRFQAKGSYTPAGEAYTKAESNARYLQGTKLGAEGHIVINSSGAVSRVPAGCVMTGWQPEGQNIGGDPCYYKPIQQNINGTWATITG